MSLNIPDKVFKQAKHLQLTYDMDKFSKIQKANIIKMVKSGVTTRFGSATSKAAQSILDTYNLPHIAVCDWSIAWFNMNPDDELFTHIRETAALSMLGDTNQHIAFELAIIMDHANNPKESGQVRQYYWDEESKEMLMKTIKKRKTTIPDGHPVLDVLAGIISGKVKELTVTLWGRSIHD